MGMLCGVDMIEVSRIKASIEKLGDSFLKKVFSQDEIDYCENKKLSKYQSYAARFAAKEAASKALGMGIGSAVGWCDIKVTNNSKGKPNIELLGNSLIMLKELKIKNIDISLSHCAEYAIAYVIMETE